MTKALWKLYKTLHKRLKSDHFKTCLVDVLTLPPQSWHWSLLGPYTDQFVPKGKERKRQIKWDEIERNLNSEHVKNKRVHCSLGNGWHYSHGNKGLYWPGISRRPQAWRTWRPPLQQEIIKVWIKLQQQQKCNSKYVLTHNKKSESIEQSTDIGQQPHQHCKLGSKNKASIYNSYGSWACTLKYGKRNTVRFISC